jgi:hypothetical protein
VSRVSLISVAALTILGGCHPLCTANGDVSVNGDGSDCCAVGYNPTTNVCGSDTACTATGDTSKAGDGSDCCNGYDATTNVCQCVPNDQASATGDGTDCCTGAADWNADTNFCGECIGNGVPSAAADGTDCCSSVGQWNSLSNVCGGCVTAGKPSQGTAANMTAGSDCCAGESYDSATNDCGS